MNLSVPLPHGAPATADFPNADFAAAGYPGTVLARFLQLRGRRIFQASGALWHTVPGRFLMSLPYDRMIDAKPDELRHLIRDAGAFGVRFPSVTWSGLASGMYILRPGKYGIDSLHIKHRPRVRHALKHFEFRRASKAELIDQGRALNLGTMARQERYDPEFGERLRWERFVDAAFACPGISVPAVFSGSRLAAYMILCREQGWLHILHQMSRVENLPDFPNHLLTYSVTAEAGADPSLESVSYGYVPLFAADGLHEYKSRFGYQLVPHRSAIQLNPWIKTLANLPFAQFATRIARQLRPKDQRLETVESVLAGARSSTRG